jgi:hypothetical protein
MGQYYKVVNTTKGQYLKPHTFGSGAKLMEFSSDGMSIMQGLAILLADGNNRGGGDLYSDNPLIGSWAGDSVIVTGDYADEGKFVPVKNRKENLYTYASENYEDISQEVICCLCEDRWWKQEYYNQWKAQNFEDWNEERQHMKENLFGIRGCKMEMEGQDA